MLRSSLTAAGVLLVGASALAQTHQFEQRRAVDLGTYRLATGQWVSPSSSSLNLDLTNSIYDNTCLPGGGLLSAMIQLDNTEINVDSGQIAGPDNTGGTLTGSSASYTVQGWRWAVCPGEPNNIGITMTATIFFLQSMNSCGTVALGSNTAASAPITAGFNLGGLPPGGSSNVCYIFNVNLENSTFEFNMDAEGDGVYDGPGDGAANDTFGVAMVLARSDAGAFTGTNGFGIAGDPGTVPFGPGCQDAAGVNGPAGNIGFSTSFLMPAQAIDTSSGLGNVDALEAVLGPMPGCYNFGYATSVMGAPAPYGALHHEIFAIPNNPPDPTFPEGCNGDGGDQMGCTECPCGNNAPVGTIGGCLNSGGTSSRLLASGSASVSAANLRFEASGVAPLNSCVLTSGNAAAPAQAANPCFAQNPGSGIQAMALDGLRCAVQSVLRHGVRPSDMNGDVGVTTNGWGDPNGFFQFSAFVSGSTKFFQIIHRDDDMDVCLTGQNTSQLIQVDFVM